MPHLSLFGLGYFSGTVKLNNDTISGAVLYLYERDSGAYIGSTTSSGDGGFYIQTTISGEQFIVALDPDGTPNLNDIIVSKITPELLP